jgi:hypothetical protein
MDDGAHSSWPRQQKRERDKGCCDQNGRGVVPVTLVKLIARPDMKEAVVAKTKYDPSRNCDNNQIILASKQGIVKSRLI